ncbi:hypothetical protein [Pseudoalteromonas galatheae]|uniref:hypothetical protein n=1 Tax=Pseudoalteromonas galatheae TaxID=579562 RepID=UPI0030CC9A31
MIIKGTAKQKRTRANRPFACLNRAALNTMLDNPSKYACLQAQSGKTTQIQFLRDIAAFMDLLVSEMCFVTRKIGVATKNGFLLRTWRFVAIELGIPEWRVKQILRWVRGKGWITSVQPRERYQDKNGNDAYKGLASIKRVTKKYLSDLGLADKFKEASIAARDYIKIFAKNCSVKVKTVLTPITMLKKFSALSDKGIDSFNRSLDELERTIRTTVFI